MKYQLPKRLYFWRPFGVKGFVIDVIEVRIGSKCHREVGRLNGWLSISKDEGLQCLDSFFHRGHEASAKPTASKTYFFVFRCNTSASPFFCNSNNFCRRTTSRSASKSVNVRHYYSALTPGIIETPAGLLPATSRRRKPG